MQFILTTGWEDGIADLTERLVKELAGGSKVLWLVSGGSNIKASVQIMENISAELSRNLSITLTDERYGRPGHSESNWMQLLEAGFDTKDAHLFPVLQGDDDFKQALERYQQLIARVFKENNVTIAQFGIGPDGHIAGILPESEATAKTDQLVTGYKTDTYQRLTLTFPGLRKISAGYAFAFGAPKKDALQRLQTEDVPLSEQPSQILKELPEAYLYSDQVKDNG